MEQDDIVETSDAEELEEICATKQIYWHNGDMYRRDDGHSPRKRVKVGRVVAVFTLFQFFQHIR